MISTGNPTVDMMGSINITGNVTPPAWYHNICYQNGKPCLNAVVILSDIVYWYRPREIRDENTGSVIRYEKRFKADLLQRSYQDFADQFGLSKKQVKDAFDLLENFGIIYREFRTLEIGGRPINNVLFIGLNAETLERFTNDPDHNQHVTLKDRPSQLQSGETPDTEMETLPTSKRSPVSPEGGTNTKNTTETTDREISHPIYLKLGYTTVPSSESEHSVDRMDSMDSLRTFVKSNLEYDAMMTSFRYENERRRFNEIFELICDVVSQTDGTIRIGGQDKPVEVVRSVFLKLTYEHVLYVMDSLEKTATDIKNIRAYMITALYRAPQTMDNCISQQVTHDTIT